MALGNILQKSDLAIVDYLVSANAGTRNDVFPAKQSLDKPLPCTIVESRTAKQVSSPVSGIWEVDVTVWIRTEGLGEDSENQSGLPAATAADRVASTIDAFRTNLDQSGEDLAAQINQNSTIRDFRVQDVSISELRAGFEAKGDAWVDAVDLKVICTTNDEAV